MMWNVGQKLRVVTAKYHGLSEPAVGTVIKSFPTGVLLQFPEGFIGAFLPAEVEEVE